VGLSIAGIVGMTVSESARVRQAERDKVERSGNRNFTLNFCRNSNLTCRLMTTALKNGWSTPFRKPPRPPVRFRRWQDLHQHH